MSLSSGISDARLLELVSSSSSVPSSELRAALLELRELRDLHKRVTNALAEPDLWPPLQTDYGRGVRNGRETLRAILEERTPDYLPPNEPFVVPGTLLRASRSLSDAEKAQRERIIQMLLYRTTDKELIESAIVEAEKVANWVWGELPDAAGANG